MSGTCTAESKCRRLTRADFCRESTDLARYLLGKVLVRDAGFNAVLKGRIVETEAYNGVTDAACHSYNGRRTSRTESLFLPPGTAYVYKIYGMYHCLNFTCNTEGGCALIRALQPLQGQEKMRSARSSLSPFRSADRFLANGPSKLCVAFNIDKETCNRLDTTRSEHLWIEDDGCIVEDEDTITSPRIGIDSYGETAARQPWRFYIRNSQYVSKRAPTDPLKSRRARGSVLP